MKQLLFIFTIVSFTVQAQFRCQEIKTAFTTQSSSVPSINNNAKSDTIDILHYDLFVDLYSISNRILKGVTTIHLTPKINGVHAINLDLLRLQIDSVRLLPGINLAYTYNDTILRVDLGNNYSPSDTLLLEITYHGQPQGDASGWGGFHIQNGYYYNLGVGFSANPHTYGRAWFPCFDNFVEKSTYRFQVLTQAPDKAYCNGIRVSQAAWGGDTLFSEWSMTDEIPTYLASVAASTYQEINDSVMAAGGNLPVQLMARAADTTRLKNSFINLKPALLAFEDYFGPYQWQKIGYAATTVGAMEHATSIHYPVHLIDGTLNDEDIMAHELAHHWWGNLLTCQTAEDMWINEGMAEFSSHLYQEKVYNRQKYIRTVRDNAFQVLNSAHRQDNGYRAISGLPHEYTYGFHVYQKGAMVAHNLRAYLGDSLFFNGLTSLLGNHAFANISTLEFRDQLSQITGYPLATFFNNWVLNPGFPSFAIDSFHFPALPADTAFVRVAQNTREAPALFDNVPVDITFFSATGDTVTRTMICSGAFSSKDFPDLPFQPASAIAGYSGKLLSGDTYDSWKLDQVRFYPDQYSKMRIAVNSIQDSARLLVMHHWAGPNGKTAPGKDYRISRGRFWTVQGTDLQKANISARINYDGTANGFDSDLLQTTEDSLVVLYRQKPWENWELYPDQQKTDLGSSTNKLGYFDLTNLRPGDYVLANSAEKISIEELNPEKGSINIYPNPARSKIHIDLGHQNTEDYRLKVSDSTGRVIFSQNYKPGEFRNLTIDLKGIASQFIIVSLNDKSYKISLVK